MPASWPSNSTGTLPNVGGTPVASTAPGATTYPIVNGAGGLRMSGAAVVGMTLAGGVALVSIRHKTWKYERLTSCRSCRRDSARVTRVSRGHRRMESNIGATRRSVLLAGWEQDHVVLPMNATID